ncbi:unnamed protein product, partial [Rotaria magnacalcarata]
ISPLDSATIISGAHLMDTEGGQLPKSDLNSSLITICMLTAMDLVRNQVNNLIVYDFFICFSSFYTLQHDLTEELLIVRNNNCSFYYI